MKSETIRRVTVHFTGHVQGVGFRYATMQVAKGYDVTGFVQNLPDGRVLLVAEGGEAEVNQFVGMVSERMAGYIRSTDRSAVDGARQHAGFGIQ